MKWSFSRLNSFSQCPYEWRKKYIDCEWGEGSAFGEFGTLCHELLEGFFNGEIGLFELSPLYQERFNEVITHDFPPNKYIDMRQSYYDKGLDYFDNLMIDIEPYEIIGVEKKVEFELDGYPFVGFIDLLLRDKKSGKITILDHKSASIKILKSGKISKSDQAHFLEFQRQLYLYSLPVIEEYGRTDFLKWNMFKDQNEIEIPWNKEDFESAKKWAVDTIHEIEKEELWLPNPDFFYCHNLCSQRNSYCEYKTR